LNPNTGVYKTLVPTWQARLNQQGIRALSLAVIGGLFRSLSVAYD